VPRIRRAVWAVVSFAAVIAFGGCGSQESGSPGQGSDVSRLDEVAAGPPKTALDVLTTDTVASVTTPATGPGPTIPRGRSDDQLAAQSAADSAMIWVGQAYRELARAGELTDVGLRNLNAGYTGRAYAAERDVYREYAKNPSALAAAPQNPVLYVERVREVRPTCFVVQAEFDEDPILAFPTGSGQKVVAVLRLDDGFWRITTFARSEAEDSSRIDCETT
jgi:hypothetical protein